MILKLFSGRGLSDHTSLERVSGGDCIMAKSKTVTNGVCYFESDETHALLDSRAKYEIR